MQRPILCLVVAAAPLLMACNRAGGDSLPSEVVGRVLVEMADSVFAAARARNAASFASYFSDRQDFFYAINMRLLRSRGELFENFSRMLGNHSEYDVSWTDRHVQTISPTVGVFTGYFETRALRRDGERWEVRGLVTFVAHRTGAGWEIVNWHTSEPIRSQNQPAPTRP